MIHAKLLGGILSAGVGAGIIGGVTHLVIGGSNDKLGHNSANPEDEELTEEDLIETKQSFFAVAIEEKNKSSSKFKKSCSISTDCSVYKISGSFSLSEDESKKTNITEVNLSSEIKPNLQYVLKLITKKLKSKDQVEIAFSDGDKHLFEIKSSAAIADDNSVKPTLPKGILPKSKLLIPKKDSPSFSNWTKEQKESRKYYTDLYPTFIEREPKKHEDFLVLSWDPVDPKKQWQIFWPLENGVMLDRFIFKPIDDQLEDKYDNSEIIIDINSKEQGTKAVFEIYEIKNQEQLKRAFAAKTTDRHKKFTPTVIDWDEIASENVMITKLTALEHSKYYKFVFKDYQKISFTGDEERGLSSIILKKVYLDPSNNVSLVHKIFEIDQTTTEPIPSYCSYIKNSPNLTYCKWMYDA